MKAVSHPSAYIDHELVQVLRNHAAEAELMKQLHRHNYLSFMRKNGFSYLYLPLTMG